MTYKIFVYTAIAAIAIWAGLPSAGYAQQADSRLFNVTKSGTVRVCQNPLYYGISYRSPTSGELEGLDVDLSNEFAKELGVELEVVESNWASFIADIQADKCDIGMFGVGATLKRAQAVEFSKPYLLSGVYALGRKDGKVQTWESLDQPGVRVLVTLGSFMEPLMEGYLKKADLIKVTPPATSLNELMSNRGDVWMVDYPAGIKVIEEFSWAKMIEPTEVLTLTPYAYVVKPGDQIWLNYINLFVDTIKRDGRLRKYAELNRLGPIVAP